MDISLTPRRITLRISISAIRPILHLTLLVTRWSQNVESEYFQQSLQPDLAPLGYKGQFVAAPGGGAIGVATFWSTQTFKLLKVGGAVVGWGVTMHGVGRTTCGSWTECVH